MDCAGLALSIVPLSIKLIIYLKNVKDAPESCQELIAQFDLYREYAQQVVYRKKNNQLSDKAEQILQQQRKILERLNAILQNPKLQKLLELPAIIIEAQSSTIIEDQSSVAIDISDASSIISTKSSTISETAADATSETESSISVGVRRCRKRDKFKQWLSISTLKTGGKKDSRIYLNPPSASKPQKQGVGLGYSQALSTQASNSMVENSFTTSPTVNRWLWPFQEAEVKELLQSLERITSVLHKLLQLEHMELSSNVLDKLTDIDNSVGRVNASLSKTEGTLKEVRKGFAEMKETVLDSQARIADVSNDVADAKNVAVETRTVAVKMHSMFECGSREKAYEWLSPLTFWSMQHNFYANLEPGTGKWLLEDERYTKWLQGEFRVLFCYGMPGAGKTTLTSLVIQRLSDKYDTKQESSSKKRVAIAFLFCNSGDRQTQTIQNLLGSILRQLEECCYVMPDLGELYAEYWGKHKRNLSLKEIMERIKKCASALEKVFLIVDALDESPHQSELVRIYLFDLIHSHANIQLLATSRPDRSIEEFFMENDCSSLQIQAKDSDMRLYLEARIEEFSKTGKNLYRLIKADNELQDEVIEKILQQACGMFLIAQLHITSIANIPSRKMLEEALRNLPKNLEHTYHDTIVRIKEHTAEFWRIIQRALMLVTFTLDWLEPEALLEAIAMHEDSGFDKDDKVDKAYLLSNCAGLLIEEEHKDATAQNKASKLIVRFVHHSTREFFEKNPHLLLPSTYISGSPTDLIAEAHSVITLVCLAYLTIDRGEAYQDAQWDGKDLSNDFPFLWYSFCYWGVHASKALKDRVEDKLYKYFDQEWCTGYSNASHCYRVFDTFWDFQNDQAVPDFALGRSIHAASGSGSVFVAALIFDLRLLVKGYILRDPTFIPSLPGSFLRICLTAVSWTGNLDLLRQLWIRVADIDLNYIDNAIGSCMRARTPCWAAAYNGHDKVVKLLLGNDKVNVNMPDNNGLIPLYVATGRGHDKVVELLLANNKIDVNMAAEDDVTPLYAAAFKGHHKVVKLLLANDQVDVNLTDKDGCTPLYVAAQEGHSKVVELLLWKDRVNVNLTAKYGCTPLYAAAVKGHHKVVKLLLENGQVDVNLTDKDGCTPLYAAAFNGHHEVIELLLANGEVNINTTAKDGCTPLYVAAFNGHHEVVGLLLSNHQVDVNMTNEDGWTALYAAAFKGHHKVVELLLQNNWVDVNTTDKYGRTPLYVAAQEGNSKVVELLLVNDWIDVNKANKVGTTPLCIAAQKGHSKEVELLLANDRVDVNIANEDGWTPLYTAILEGYHEDIDKAAELLQGNEMIDINMADEDDLTLFGKVARERHAKVVELLLANERTDVNIATKKGMTPLLVAAFTGHSKMVELLLANDRIDVNMGDQINGYTPLFLAAQGGLSKIVKLLLAVNGIDVNRGDTDGNTPLHAAAINGHVGVTELLLAHDKIDIMKVNASFTTALDYATERGHDVIVALFLSKLENDIKV